MVRFTNQTYGFKRALVHKNNHQKDISQVYRTWLILHYKNKLLIVVAYNKNALTVDFMLFVLESKNLIPIITSSVLNIEDGKIMSDKNLNDQPDVELQESAEVVDDVTVEPVVEGVIVDSVEQRVVELEKALADSEAKALAQKDGVLRARADIENMRRRVAMDVEKAHKFALNKFATELLPVVDNLDRALTAIDKEDEQFKSVVEGLEMTLTSLIGALEKSGVKQIDPVGETFNPELHQAMTMIEVPGAEPNSVIDVMQKGFELNGRLLRPAMVVVAKATPLDTTA